MVEHDRQNDTHGVADAHNSCSQLSLATGAPFLLPFVGRESDLLRLLSFVRNAVATPFLSLLWIEGEGGVGKSRLLKEAKKQIAPNILILNVAACSDTSFSLSQSLAKTLGQAAPTSSLQSSAPLDSLSSILAFLRELGRRQPMLLVFEDIHLLDVKEVADLVVLLHGMEYERLGVLCIARPGNETVLGAVLPFLRETIKLHPLNLHALRQLGKVWGYDLDKRPNLTQFLHERTRGIPLVIQAAIRKLLSYRPELQKNPIAAVRYIAKETKRSIAHTLTAELSQQDKEGARRLATLGETFSVQGAAIVLDAPGIQITRLQRAGVLIESFGEEEPLHGVAPDDIRYSFSHSLLHEQLLSEALPPDNRLLTLLLSDIPFYGTTFFVYIAQTLDLDVAPEKIAAILERLVSDVEGLIDSPMWKAAAIIHTSAQTIFRRYRKKLPAGRERQIRFQLLRSQLRILNAFPSHPDFIAAVDELLLTTKDPINEEQAVQRLTALEYSIFRTDEGWNFRTDTAFNEIEDLVEGFPAILLHPTYIALLGNITGALRASGSTEDIYRARKRFDRLIAAAQAVGNEGARRTALLEIAPSFLSLFRTQEELTERKQLAETIAAECGEDRPVGRFTISWPRFLESIGEMHRAAHVLAQWTPHPLTGYNLSMEFALRMLELVVNAALDTPIAEIERESFRILEEFQQIQEVEGSKGGDQTLAQTSVALHVIVAAVMRDEIAWGTTLSQVLSGKNDTINHYMAFERAALTKDRSALQRLEKEGQIRSDLLPLVRYSIGHEDVSKEQAIHTARTVLEDPVIQRSNILSTRLVLALLSLTIEDPQRDLRPALRESILKGTHHAVQWLTERKIPAYLRPLLKDMRPFIDSDEKSPATIDKFVEQHRQSDRTHLKTNGETTEQETQSRVKISMIGEITYTEPNRKPAKVRGPRPQQLLGLLTANELLAGPISLADFRVLVTGSGSQEESGNYLRVLVSRMRKQLGPDAILSDGEAAPRLNLARVQVDLIDVTNHIRRGISMARNRRGDQAREAVLQGMELLAKGEPYPNLSDKIFAAAREELHTLLRHGLIEIATLLRNKAKKEQAINLLKKGLELLNDDKELLKAISTM